MYSTRDPSREVAQTMMVEQVCIRGVALGEGALGEDQKVEDVALATVL